MNKNDDSGTGSWLKFFKDAGIPTKTGASYALIFTENRIHKDMLADMTVDYLRLMGITLMGDIIAILRHCKSVHQDSLRKVVILQSKETPSTISSRSSSSSSDSSSDEDVEMVEVTKQSHKKITTKPNINTTSSKKTESQIKQESPPRTDLRQLKSKVIGKTISSSATSDIKTAPQPVKRKYEEETEKATTVYPPSQLKTSGNSGRSILKTANSSVKNIRVVSENDIIGPKLPPPKKTVFERLGAENDSSVSSTTEMLKPVKPQNLETKFTRTISNITLPKTVRIIDDVDMDSPTPKVSSVFDRLGGLKVDPSTTTVKGPTLPYVGVLKSPPIVKKPILNVLKRTRTMRADEPEVPAKLRAAPKPLSTNSIKVRVGDSSVKGRLQPRPRINRDGLQPRLRINREGLQPRPIINRDGLLNFKSNIKSEGIFANPTRDTNVTVRERLGLSTTSKRPSSSTLIKRIRRPPSPCLTKKYDEDDENNEDEDDKHTFRSHVEFLRSKKVSFGTVEHKIISPVPIRTQRNTPGRFQRNRFNIRGRAGGVHSRLGVSKF